MLDFRKRDYLVPFLFRIVELQRSLQWFNTRFLYSNAINKERVLLVDSKVTVSLL